MVSSTVKVFGRRGTGGESSSVYDLYFRRGLIGGFSCVCRYGIQDRLIELLKVKGFVKVPGCRVSTAISSVGK